MQGTVSWMAPEVFGSEDYTNKADVYRYVRPANHSFAVVVWEILSQELPYPDLDSWQIPVHVTKGNRPPLPDDTPKKIAELVKACWQTKAQKRPPMTTVVDALQDITKDYHVYFNDL